MNTRLPSLLLAAVAAAASYVVIVVGDFVPRFLEVGLKLKAEEVAAIMLPPTRFAVGSSWVFVVTLLLAVAVALLLFRMHPGQVVRVTVATLCVEAVVVWIAFFCYCYGGFCGPMSLHHGPEFDALEFCRFEGGVFPVTLVLILIPLIGCFAGRSQFSARAAQAPAGTPTPKPSAS